MTCLLTREIRPGVLFGALSDTGVPEAPFNGPCIVIPLHALHALDDATLAQGVRALLPLAEGVRALSFADWVTTNCAGSRNPSLVLASFIFEEPYAADVAWLERDAGHDPLIDTALAYLQRARQRRTSRQQAPDIRRELRTNYDRLFIAIGRRDGFQCSRCGAHTNLEIDHRTPVALGGTNTLSNLCVLCRTCNHTKRDTEETYPAAT